VLEKAFNTENAEVHRGPQRRDLDLLINHFPAWPTEFQRGGGETDDDCTMVKNKAASNNPNICFIEEAFYRIDKIHMIILIIM